MGIKVNNNTNLFIDYLQEFTTNFTYWEDYIIMLIFIISGLIINILNINIIGYTVNIIFILCIIPFIIGFIISIPDMSFNNTLIGKCNNISYPAAISSIILSLRFGWEGFTVIMDEIDISSKRKLPVIYCISIIIIYLLHFISYITTSSLYPNCDDWLSYIKKKNERNL